MTLGTVLGPCNDLRGTRVFHAILRHLMPNLVGSEEYLPQPTKRPWLSASWEAGMIWQQLMQTFPRPWGENI